MEWFKRKDQVKYSKSFMSGALVPSAGLALVVPLMYAFSAPTTVLAYLAVLPFIWGVWNIVYEASERPYNIGYHGLILGFVTAVFDISAFGTASFCGLTGGLQLLLLFFEPLIYYFAWYYVTEWFNNLVGLR